MNILFISLCHNVVLNHLTITITIPPKLLLNVNILRRVKWQFQKTKQTKMIFFKHYVKNFLCKLFDALYFLSNFLGERMSKIAILVKDKLPGQEWRQTLFIVNQMAQPLKFDRLHYLRAQQCICNQLMSVLGFRFFAQNRM